MRNQFELDNKGLGIDGDTQNITDYKLYLKGSAHIPARFWEYKLINVTRGYEKDILKANGFLEINIIDAIKKHNGISFSILGN